MSLHARESLDRRSQPRTERQSFVWDHYGSTHQVMQEDLGGIELEDASNVDASEDAIFEKGGAKVVVDEASLELVAGVNNRLWWE